MITCKQGDIFNDHNCILVNPVNCHGIMDKGLALKFKQKYPSMFKSYEEACACDDVFPGHPHVYTDKSSGITIINFPTKINWKLPSKYAFINLGLAWLHGYLYSKIHTVVGIPALGCGLGGLEWPEVLYGIHTLLGDLSCEINVYEPKQ